MAWGGRPSSTVQIRGYLIIGGPSRRWRGTSPRDPQVIQVEPRRSWIMIRGHSDALARAWASGGCSLRRPDWPSGVEKGQRRRRGRFAWGQAGAQEREGDRDWRRATPWAAAEVETPVWPLRKRTRGSSQSVPETGGCDHDRIDACCDGHHCRVDNQVVERGVSGTASVQMADVSGRPARSLRCSRSQAVARSRPGHCDQQRPPPPGCRRRGQLRLTRRPSPPPGGAPACVPRGEGAARSRSRPAAGAPLRAA